MQSISRYHILPIVSQSVIFSVIAMGACLQTGCMLILLQHIACSWWILTSRTFPQLQSLHCRPPPSSQVPQLTIHKRVGEPLHWALPPLLLVQSSLVLNKNRKIRKRDSERSSIVFPSADLSSLFICAFPALSASQSVLALWIKHGLFQPFVCSWWVLIYKLSFQPPFTVRVHSTFTSKSNHLNWTCALLCQHVNICSWWFSFTKLSFEPFSLCTSTSRDPKWTGSGATLANQSIKIGPRKICGTPTLHCTGGGGVLI